MLHRIEQEGPLLRRTGFEDPIAQVGRLGQRLLHALPGQMQDFGQAELVAQECDDPIEHDLFDHWCRYTPTGIR